MDKQVTSAAIVVLLLLSIVVLGHEIKKVKSDWTWTETIHIKPDGSIYPASAPISTLDNITYTMTDNIVADVPELVSVVFIGRSNIVFDGAGYTIREPNADEHSSKAVNVTSQHNVTIKNINTRRIRIGVFILWSINCNVLRSNLTGVGLDYGSGIYLKYSNSCIVSENIVKDFSWGIGLVEDHNCSVLDNYVRYAKGGIVVDRKYRTQHNVISGNQIWNCQQKGIYLAGAFSTISGNYIDTVDPGWAGIELFECRNASIMGNYITNCEGYGIHLVSNRDNVIIENDLVNNNVGILIEKDFNELYHNSFINNTQQVTITHSANNSWDNNCEGNYWADYNGSDLNGDGIGDSPVILDERNVDRYPLMNPYWHFADFNHDLKVDIFDAVLMCDSYYSTPSDPHWNCHCDIVEPFGLIDLFDVVLMADSYGEEYHGP